MPTGTQSLTDVLNFVYILIVIITNTRINQLIKNSNHEDPFEIQGKIFK